MSNKFDLERFKYGEPAYDEDGWEKIYLATSPSGEVIYWNVELKMPGSLQKFQLDTWTMKPKDEWVYLPKSYDRYKSKEEAENAFGKHLPDVYEAVKIIRE